MWVVSGTNRTIVLRKLNRSENPQVGTKRNRQSDLQRQLLITTATTSAYRRTRNQHDTRSTRAVHKHECIVPRCPRQVKGASLRPCGEAIVTITHTHMEIPRKTKRAPTNAHHPLPSSPLRVVRHACIPLEEVGCGRLA